MCRGDLYVSRLVALRRLAHNHRLKCAVAKSVGIHTSIEFDFETLWRFMRSDKLKQELSGVVFAIVVPVEAGDMREMGRRFGQMLHHAADQILEVGNARHDRPDAVVDHGFGEWLPMDIVANHRERDATSLSGGRSEEH